MNKEELLLIFLFCLFFILITALILKLRNDKNFSKLIYEHKLKVQNFETLFLNEQKTSKSLLLNKDLEIKNLHKEYELKLQYQKTSFEQEYKNSNEKLLILQDAKFEMKKEFELLNKKLFDESSIKSNNNLALILKPFKEQLDGFKNRVNDIYNDESMQRSSLLTEIKNLKDLNNKISQDAINLTKALKGENKTQGDWGEMILSKILDNTGLKEGQQYFTQKSYLNDDGKRLRPDVVIKMPNEKDIIIDSKVSLVSYTKYLEATKEENRELHIKEFNKSILAHIKDLSSKKYESLKDLNSLDFVLLFIPIDGAFNLLSSSSNNLFEVALKHNIMIVSSSTLFVSLRTIENIWRNEHQNENALLIAKKAGHLYDKFYLFVKDLEDIGLNLDKSKTSYDKAFNKLCSGNGNLIKRSEEFLTLGVKAKNEILIKTKD